MAKPDDCPSRWPSRYKFLLLCAFAVLFLTSCGKQAKPDPKPQAQPPPPFEFLGTWGDKGEGPGKLDEPATFSVDALGNVFFADPAAGFVHKFTSNGTPLLSFEDPRLHRASGIAVDSGGAIYVADAARGTVLIFFPDGTFYRARQVALQPHFSGTLGISVDISGHLYAPDPARSRVAKFDPQGRPVKSWIVPKAGAADELPSAIATVKDDFVFVAFAKTGRIEKYSSDGTWITSWMAASNLAGGPHSITGFAVTDDFVFTLIISDELHAPTETPSGSAEPAGASSPQIRVWTLDGQFKSGYLDERLGKMAAPQIVVTPHDELLVFDPPVPRVFRYRIHLSTKDKNDAAARGS